MQNLSELDFFKKRLSQTESLLGIKQSQIDALLEITRAVNNNMPIATLGRIYENVLRAQMGVQNMALFVQGAENKVQCIACTEDRCNLANYNFLSRVAQLNYVTPIKALGDDDALADFEYVIPVLHNKQFIGVALIGAFGSDQNDTKEEKLKFIQTLTNIVVVANENKKLARSRVDQMMLQKELKLAADMQNMLVPASLPCNETVEASAFYKPHKDIGGDYYDFMQLSEFEYAFCISDISGKGIPAAILMANFQANIRILLRRRYSLTQFIDVLNEKVCEITKGEKFITCFIAVYNSITRKLSYVNAGHNPSVLFANGKVTLLEDGCTILGMFDNLPFIASGEMQIPPDTLIVNYTDGLTEAMNSEGQLFEPEGLIRFIHQAYTLNLPDFNKQLIDNVVAFKQNTDFDDDITLLTVRLR